MKIRVMGQGGDVPLGEVDESASARICKVTKR